MHSIVLAAQALFANPQNRAVLASALVLFLLCVIGLKVKSPTLYVLCGMAFIVFLGCVFYSSCTTGMMACTFVVK